MSSATRTTTSHDESFVLQEDVDRISFLLPDPTILPLGTPALQAFVIGSLVVHVGNLDTEMTLAGMGLILKQNGADVNVRDKKGWTTFHLLAHLLNDDNEDTTLPLIRFLLLAS